MAQRFPKRRPEHDDSPKSVRETSLTWHNERLVSVSDSGPKSENHDGVVVHEPRPRHYRIMVMDGIGGGSQPLLVRDILMELFEHPKSAQAKIPALMNYARILLRERLFRERNDGAAVCVADITAQKLEVWWSGDTITMVMRHNEHEHWETAILTPPHRLDMVSLTQSVNGLDTIRGEQTQLDLLPGDIVLVATDGITDTLTYKDIEAFLNSTNKLTPKHLARWLQTTTRERMQLRQGKPDNFTFALYFVPEETGIGADTHPSQRAAAVV